MTATGLALQRASAGFVLVLMAIGSAALWIAVPYACLRALGALTDSQTTHFLAALLVVPAAMALFARFLFWLNGLYLRITGVMDRLEEDEDVAEWRRRVRGPLEPILLVSLAVEFAALCVWFFFLAEDPARIII